MMLQGAKSYLNYTVHTMYMYRVNVNQLSHSTVRNDKQNVSTHSVSAFASVQLMKTYELKRSVLSFLTVLQES